MALQNPESEKDRQIVQLREELNAAKKRLQQTIEEAAANCEELKASNEDLWEENRQLKSSNQELLNLNSRHLMRLLEIEQEQMFAKAFIDAIPDLGIIFDGDGRVVQRMTSNKSTSIHAQGDIRGKLVTELFPEPIADLFLTTITETLSFGQPMSVDYELETEKGWRSFYGRTSKIEGLISGKEAVIWISNDNTERKRIRKELIFNRERLDLAIIGTNDGIWDWIDVNSDKEWWSPRYYELLGYTQEELPASLSNFKKILHPGDLETTYEAINACLNDNVPFDVEYRLKTKDLGYRWFRGRGNVTHNSMGKPIRMAGSISDIHETKMTKITLLATQKFMEKVTSIVPSIIYVFNQMTMSNEYVNRELATSLGYSAQEVQEFGNEFLPRVCHPDDLEHIFENFAAIKKLKDGEVNQVRYRMRHKDGGYRWLMSIDAVFERDDDGKVIKHIGVATDVTQLKEIEFQLRENAEMLNEKVDDLEQFAYVATHDLKVPINIIEGHFNFLKGKVSREEPEVAESIGYVEDGIAQFQRTVNGLVHALKVQEADAIQEQIFLEELFRDLDYSFQVWWEECESELILEGLEGISIYASRINAISIIQNLVNNAAKYRSPERCLKVLIRAEIIDKMVCLSIQDNGLGIDLALQKDKLFGMFNRFHDHVEGTGMGLYMVKRMIEREGGKVEVSSEVGVGTTFSVYFKLKA